MKNYGRLLLEVLLLAGSIAGIWFLWAREKADAAVFTIPIGFKDCRESSARDINNGGQAVGWAKNEAGCTRAFFWSEADGFVDLGALGGVASEARGINDAGRVVGVAEMAEGGRHAFCWSRERGMVDLGTLGGEKSEAWAINSRGQVVGTAETADGEMHAFIWEEAHGMRDLGTLGGVASEARAINDVGRVVGSFQDKEGKSHAFYWDDLAGMRAIKVVEGASGYALSISDYGVVAGVGAFRGGEKFVFIWQVDDGVRDVFRPEMARGVLGQTINARGEHLVGFCYFKSVERRGCFAFAERTDRREPIAFLPVDGGDESMVFALNNAGQAVGHIAWNVGPFGWTGEVPWGEKSVRKAVVWTVPKPDARKEKRAEEKREWQSKKAR